MENYGRYPREGFSVVMCYSGIALIRGGRSHLLLFFLHGAGGASDPAIFSFTFSKAKVLIYDTITVAYSFPILKWQGQTRQDTTFALFAPLYKSRETIAPEPSSETLTQNFPLTLKTISTNTTKPHQ